MNWMNIYLILDGIMKFMKSLAAHKMTVDGKDGVYFAVWAPHAKAVGVAAILIIGA